MRQSYEQPYHKPRIEGTNPYAECWDDERIDIAEHAHEVATGGAVAISQPTPYGTMQTPGVEHAGEHVVPWGHETMRERLDRATR